jgi:hypothetical protein
MGRRTRAGQSLPFETPLHSCPSPLIAVYASQEYYQPNLAVKRYTLSHPFHSEYLQVFPWLAAFFTACFEHTHKKKRCNQRPLCRA